MSLGKIRCSCGGNNENCFRCFGTGLFGEEAAELPSKEAPELHTKQAPVTVEARNVLYETCPECRCSMPSKSIAKHIKKVHRANPRSTAPSSGIKIYRIQPQQSTPKAKPESLTPPGWKLVCVQCGFRALTNTDVDTHYTWEHPVRAKPFQQVRQNPPSRPLTPIKQPQNSVKPQKESRFDGSRDYYTHYREDSNRLGSHPMHDDYGDEASP